MSSASVVALCVVVVAAVAAILVVWRVRRLRPLYRRPLSGQADSGPAAIALRRPDFPSAGLLVSEDVLQSAGSSSGAIWDALEVAVTPVAIEYFPVTNAEIAKFKTVPLNATVQQSMIEIVKALNPKGPTLFTVVLPKGAELVKAVGASGFRGFSRTAGRTAHAVLKPVALGGAVAAGWPLFAVAGTVLVVDMVAQREQRAHQRYVEAILGRHEERYYVERIKNQRSADAQLSRSIGLLLDGHKPNLELALKSAHDEFLLSEQFLEKYRGVTDALVDEEGKVDYRRLEAALGGKSKDVDFFIRELHLAKAAIAIRRKALVTEAAALALADPTNPYAALRRFIDAQVQSLGEADTAATGLTESLLSTQLKGRWHDRNKSVAVRQERLRAQMSPSAVEGDTQIRYLLTASGEVLQVLAPDADVPLRPEATT